VFDSLSERLSGALAGLRGKGRLSDADIDATAREIRIALLEADVALPVVRVFIARIKERAKGAEVSGALNPAQQVVKIVNEELVAILGGETRRLRLAKEPPSVIMLAGLQGSGKTTLAGKLAGWLKGQGHTPLLVACDLQRPNAVNQLQIVGERAGVPTFAPEPGNGVGDPVDVARRGVAHAREKHYDIVIVDTAGRLGVDTELMRQASDIRDAVRPDETLFVLDAMVGQDAVTTAEAFRDGVGFSGVVLTKLDGDARGGAARSWPISTSSTPTGWQAASWAWAICSRSSSRPSSTSTPSRPPRPRRRWARASSRWKTSSTRCSPSARWARSATSSACCPAPTQGR
jgi:signal recognition particle subunit SRP54